MLYCIEVYYVQKQGGKRYIMNQREQFKRIIKFMSSLTVIAMQMSLYWIVWLYHYNSNIELPFFRKGNWLIRWFEGGIFAKGGDYLFTDTGPFLR